MRPSHRELLVFLLALGAAFSASAQDRAPHAAPPHAQSAEMPGSLTGKERLGKKWTDEQRVDNCKVPLDKRGTKPRPSTCTSSARRR